MSKKKSIDFTLFDEKLRKTLPTKPSDWSYHEVKIFLKEIVKMDHVLDMFDELEINGTTFLLMDFKDENEKILNELNLRRNEEKILFECQKKLKNYEKSFKATNISQQPNNLEKMNSKSKKKESSSSKDEKNSDKFTNSKEKKSEKKSLEDPNNKYNVEIRKEISKIEENPTLKNQNSKKEVPIPKKPQSKMPTDKNYDDEIDKGKKETKVSHINEELEDKSTMKNKKNNIDENLSESLKDQKKKIVNFNKSEPIEKQGISKEDENTIKMSNPIGTNDNFKKKKMEEIKGGDDEDSDPTQTKTNKIDTVPPCRREIIIDQVNESGQHEKFCFVKSFNINRACNNSLNMDAILLDNRSVSHKHAQVILLKGVGFALQDLGSKCHTFIKVREKTRIKLREGLEILMGNSTFKILSLTKSQIKFETKNDGEKLDIKINKEKLFFGRDPKVDDPQNEDTYQYDDDSFIELTHVIFHKEPDNIYLEPRLSALGVWVKIGNKGDDSDFYLLKKYTAFKISNFLLKVEYTICNKESLCLCSCQYRKINTVFLPCYHSHLCDICALEKKKCTFQEKKGGVCNSQEFKKLIDITEQD